MSTIEQNLQHVRQQIKSAAHQCGRDPDTVALLAVSKTKSVNMIEEALKAGQRIFGENYVQEGVEKIQHFTTTPWHPELEWHFIGPLQANKSRSVAEHFHWVHTIDRSRIAQRLNNQRPENMPALNVLIQVNISGEESKSGITPDELPELAEFITSQPRLRLRGLMTIPAPETDPQIQLAVFKRMAQVFQQLKQRYPHIDTLSMGMSDDMSAAVAAGSTLVRIGTAIFGARDYNVNS